MVLYNQLKLLASTITYQLHKTKLFKDQKGCTKEGLYLPDLIASANFLTRMTPKHTSKSTDLFV